MHSDILFKPTGGEEEVIDQIYFGGMDNKENNKAQKVLLAYIGDENGVARQVFQTSEFSIEDGSTSDEFIFNTKDNISGRIKSPTVSIFPKRYNGKAYGVEKHLEIENTSIEEVILPETITAIASGAFAKYKNLQNITLPFIGIAPFSSTYTWPQLIQIFDSSPPKLNTVTILDTGHLTNSFNGISIENLILKNVTEIPNIKYYSYDEYNKLFHSGIENIEIHGPVKTIPSGTFRYATAEVAIYAQVEHIEPDAFYNFKGGEIILPNTLKTIGIMKQEFASYLKGVFESSNITKINIPEGVTRIGYDSFRGCTKLKQITIPSTLIEIGQGAFTSTSSLKEIHISNLTNWCNVDMSGPTCSPFKSPNLTVTREIYLNCEPITTLKLDDKVITDGIIKPYIFYGYKPKNLIIGANIKEVGEQAFIDPVAAFTASNFIFYEGDQDSWKSITGKEYIVRENNEKDYLYFYSEEKPTDNTHKYWHYDDNNEPAIWKKEESAT